jgi:hypothetical protein
MKHIRTILGVGATALLLTGAPSPNAIAGSPVPCLIASRLTARVDAHNVLTTHTTLNIGSGDTTLVYSADMFRRGVREYHDADSVEVTAGTTNGDSMVELPLSWRGERITVRMHASTDCGSVDRVAVVKTQRNPLP